LAGYYVQVGATTFLPIMTIFRRWCRTSRLKLSDKKELWQLTEKNAGRISVQRELVEIVRSHYDDLARIADAIAELGRPTAAAVLRERLPRSKTARSGDLGEIIATELIEERTGFRVPVRRLRYKDGREMALRGDDFIGVQVNPEGELRLLKGEAKSKAKLGKQTITQARKALDRDSGRCTPISLLFVADRLLDRGGEDEDLGRALRAEVGRRALSPLETDHVLFTCSANAPPATLRADLQAAGDDRKHIVVNLHLPDHQAFISTIYTLAEDLGDD
jgi:hypothetical protein